MLQDLEAGKPLELDCMTGAVIELAAAARAAGAAHRRGARLHEAARRAKPGAAARVLTTAHDRPSQGEERRGDRGDDREQRRADQEERAELGRDDDVPVRLGGRKPPDGAGDDRRSGGQTDGGGYGGFPGDHPEDLSARRSDQAGQPDLVPSIGDGHRGRVHDRDRCVACDEHDQEPHDPGLLLLRRVDLVEVLVAAEHGGCRHALASCRSPAAAAAPPVT